VARDLNRSGDQHAWLNAQCRANRDNDRQSRRSQSPFEQGRVRPVETGPLRQRLLAGRSVRPYLLQNAAEGNGNKACVDSLLGTHGMSKNPFLAYDAALGTDQHQRNIVLKPGANDVPRSTIEAWLHSNRHLACVKRGDVRVAEDGDQRDPLQRALADNRIVTVL
jgi:hypothetical protein